MTLLHEDKPLKIGSYSFNSRLIIGTGKYKSYAENARALEASGAEIITVALRRVNVIDKDNEKLQDYINPKKYTYLPNSAGCYSADEAIRTLRLAREVGGWKLVKLEVIGSKENLFPDMQETLIATEILTKEGFEVMVYANDDPIYAKKIEEAGAVAIMPLAAPIGSGLGIQNKTNISLIIKEANIPVIIDAGIGTASDAVIAMEMGCAAVILNTAISNSGNPELMSLAMKHAVIAGRNAYLAGRMEKKNYATASSPVTGLITEKSQ
jgi:thiazole synthase